jgi:Hemerythrin HHE cation binding domain
MGSSADPGAAVRASTWHHGDMEAPNGPDGRLTALGNQLIEVHVWLRGELARLREDVDSWLDGAAGLPREPGELRAHCLTFCSAVSRHHGGEDGVAFPVLAEEFPELLPVIEELRRDHDMVAGILRGLDELLGGLDAGSGRDPREARRVRAELDGLAALLESHFVYEERRIVPALDSLGAASRFGARPDFLLTTAPGPPSAAGPARPEA